ncbi:hypothetical protein QJS83_00525 [Bdellovibrio sp. 22V]|uniref:hypothetical protein n=1 Tax=Bdellovibrio sp. 22V TaxID=3044166 RepID=UPI002543F5C5|nr:hypothetical protein [Bdellovibrio sp. 22V]WII72349.1 hypothetical protein QJS83_00525 [Bdellovibrio sp. 22V]
MKYFFRLKPFLFAVAVSLPSKFLLSHLEKEETPPIKPAQKTSLLSRSEKSTPEKRIEIQNKKTTGKVTKSTHSESDQIIIDRVRVGFKSGDYTK